MAAPLKWRRAKRGHGGVRRGTRCALGVVLQRRAVPAAPARVVGVSGLALPELQHAPEVVRAGTGVQLARAPRPVPHLPRLDFGTIPTGRARLRGSRRASGMADRGLTHRPRLGGRRTVPEPQNAEGAKVSAMPPRERDWQYQRCRLCRFAVPCRCSCPC